MLFDQQVNSKWALNKEWPSLWGPEWLRRPFPMGRGSAEWGPGRFGWEEEQPGVVSSPLHLLYFSPVISGYLVCF